LSLVKVALGILELDGEAEAVPALVAGRGRGFVADMVARDLGDGS